MSAIRSNNFLLSPIAPLSCFLRVNASWSMFQESRYIEHSQGIPGTSSVIAVVNNEESALVNYLRQFPDLYNFVANSQQLFGLEGRKIVRVDMETNRILWEAGSGQVGSADGPATASSFSSSISGLAWAPSCTQGVSD